MEKTQLIYFINQKLSTRDISKKLNISQTTVIWWLKKYSIKTLNKSFFKKPYLCKHCGETSEVNFYGDRKQCCKSCFKKNDTEIGKQKKLNAINHLGGKCVNCGYNNYYGALEFHHIDRTKKEDWTAIRNWGWNRIKTELEKCILLCANCHRETHGKEDYNFKN